MPGPVIQAPSLPWWADPKGASVLDKPGQGMLRQIVGLLGLDDPTQIMAVGVPVEAGANTGGMLDVLSQKFPRLANAIKAYHGSPHDFERFDSSKIGTGEGAQAYGHGLYFAENPQVAADYRRSLAAPTAESPAWRYKGEPVAMGTDNWHIASALDQRGAPKPGQSTAEYLAQQIRELENHADFVDKAYGAETGSMYRLKADTLRKLDPAELTFHQPGRTYEVAIHAHPDQFLDWDKPLSQQSEAVRRVVSDHLGDLSWKPAPDGKMALMSAKDGVVLWRDPREIAGRTPEQFISSMRGDVLYSTVFGGHTKEAASETLKAAGIPGIKYLDQGSRMTAGVDKLGDNWFVKGSSTAYPTKAAAASAAEASGGVTRNYVVFDDRLVDILKKYGIVATVAGAGAANLPERKQ